MAETRAWQAYGMRALGRHKEAHSAIEAALRLTYGRNDTATTRLRARLLASGAENAAAMRETQQAYVLLAASEALAGDLPQPTEEFDRVAWLEAAAVCALHLDQIDLSISRFSEALDALPGEWMARRMFAAIGLAGALASRRDREATLAIVRGAVPSLKAMQAQELTRHFVDSLPKLLACFPHDGQFRELVADAESRLVAGD